jgi:hypothetical protein
MRKSSKAISLVLIGSSMLFFGCDQHGQVCNQMGPDGRPSPTCSGSSRSTIHGGHFGTSGGSTATGSNVGSGTSAPGTGTGTHTGGFGTSGSSSSGGMHSSGAHS